MSALKPGTHCVIVAGCRENIGVVVEVMEHIGEISQGYDAYRIKTVSGRPFHQLWDGGDLLRDSSDEAITERHKLRPLVGSDFKADERQAEVIT